MPTSCTNSVTPNLTDLTWDVTASVPTSVNVGDPVAVTGQTWGVTIPGSVFDAGINLNLITPGQTITSTLDAVITAAGSSEGSTTVTGIPLSVVVEVNPDGTAKDAATTFTVPDVTVTAAADPVVIGLGTLTLAVDVGLPLPVTFTCEPVAGAPTIVSTTVLGASPTPTTTAPATSTTAPASTTSAPASTTSGAASTTTFPPGTVGGRVVTECSNNVTSDTSNFTVIATGVQRESGGTVRYENQKWTITIPGSVFDTGINLGLIESGQSLSALLDVEVEASNTSEGSLKAKDLPIAVTANTGSDGSARDATARFTVPAMTFHPTGSPVQLSLGTVKARVDLDAFVVTFTCNPAPGTDATFTATKVEGVALAFTGPSGMLWRFVLAIVLLDLGYIAWSATRPVRRRRA
ncbi:MAG: hypothetical protein D6683_05365 [Actinomyces sp.]|nr:MAG: hypothetical protein D6683_05365 [Actinomyces sp.]